MDGADDHVVVPAAEVVIDIDREEPSRVNAQLRSVRWGFQPVEGMAEVEQDAEVVLPHLLDGQQRAGCVREDDLVTWLARLVFDHELDLRVRGDEFAQSVDCQLPDVVIVDLERIVPAVLTEPELDVVAAEVLGQLGGFVQQFQRLGTDGRVRVGDRALDVIAVVDLRGDGYRTQVVALERSLYVVQRALETGKGPVQIDHGKVAHGSSPIDLLQQADFRPVAFGRVTVLVGGEMPDPSTEKRQVTHGHSNR